MSALISIPIATVATVARLLKQWIESPTLISPTRKKPPPAAVADITIVTGTATVRITVTGPVT